MRDHDLRSEKGCYNLDVTCASRKVIFNEKGYVLYTICPFIGVYGCYKTEEVKMNDSGRVQHPHAVITIQLT